MILLLFFQLLALASPIVVQLPAEPNTLDPYHVSDVIGFNIVSNLHLGLVKTDSAGKLQLGLAKSHKISKNNRVHTFYLDPAKTWSDGSPITPDQILFGIRHAVRKTTAARDAKMLSALKSFDHPDSPDFGVKAHKDRIVFELNYPDSAFYAALSMPLAAPMKKEFLDDTGKWIPTSPTSGSFRITRFRPDREIVLEANSKPNRQFTFKVIPEETTALNLFETGSLDILVTVPPTEAERLSKSGLIQSFPGAASFFLSFHSRKPPFADVRWRKALADSVDREDLAKLLPGLKPTRAYLPAAIFSEPEDPEVKTVAKIDKEIPAITLTYPNSGIASLLVQRIQHQWKTKLNLEVKLEPMEWKAYLGRLSADAPPLFFMGYSAPFPDVISHLKVFETDSEDNRSKFSHKEYDSLLKVVRESSGTKRQKAVSKMQRLLIREEQIVIPLVERSQLAAVSKKVSGFRINPYGVMDLSAISKP